ncbi:hypothetical protein B0H15DRAFT_796038 [Mycena belliarum]|uniref:Uncharacterized protein n=1 Tax=Mycena belliarum TaxID=1033014 RepID=A0AAD6XXB5_9AGAR|nr:hypothetical protein B0H15DRAFT_796038 [Mycena belliae]
MCEPERARKLDKNTTGIAAFFVSLKKAAPSTVGAPAPRPLQPQGPPVQKKKRTPADKRLDPIYFSRAGTWPSRLPPPTIVSEPVECQGLHGNGYREYAWQRGTLYLGGVSATEWTRLAHMIFPYKNWNGELTSESATGSSDSDEEYPEPMTEKAVRAACSITEHAMHGIQKQTNTSTLRVRWTDWEKKRLHQSLLVAARWNTQPNTGAVYSKDCNSVTTSLTGTCSPCTVLARHLGLQRAVRKARARAQLPPLEFTRKWQKKLKYTPTVRSDNFAANVKIHIANPAVLKILSSKAMHGPGGAFLALYQQAQSGDLDDKESFLAICDQFTDRVQRGKDPTGRAMKGIRYSPELGQLVALMRSHGPRSGTQYDLFKDMVGGISQRQLRRRVAKSAMKMVSLELCAGNLEATVDFGKLMKYDGPWIAAGDGTKLRPLLSTSTEFSESKSAHVLGSTRPLSEVLFTSSAEQSRIISDIDADKAIATQVWLLAIEIPLPNMLVFPVAFVPNKGRMKGQDYCDQHLMLHQLCGDAGLKFLSSAADTAKSEVNGQNLMMNVEMKTRLTYDNPFYGVHIVGVPLYIQNIFNPEKQDDGAARRLFLDTLFAFLVDSSGNIIDPTFEGFFVLSFIFGNVDLSVSGSYLTTEYCSGELLDAYMKRGMPHRASNIVKSESQYPDLFQKQSSFMADATFRTVIRLCNQYILLSLTHLEFYPNVPFIPRQHGSHFIEHYWGITCSFIQEFTFGQLIQMNKHITFRQRILASGRFRTKKEKDSNNGYSFNFSDSELTQEEIIEFKNVPSRAELDRACETSWKEAAALATQFCAMHIPPAATEQR